MKSTKKGWYPSRFIKWFALDLHLTYHYFYNHIFVSSWPKFGLNMTKLLYPHWSSFTFSPYCCLYFTSHHFYWHIHYPHYYCIHLTRLTGQQDVNMATGGGWIGVLSLNKNYSFLKWSIVLNLLWFDLLKFICTT